MQLSVYCILLSVRIEETCRRISGVLVNEEEENEAEVESGEGM